MNPASTLELNIVAPAATTTDTTEPNPGDIPPAFGLWNCTNKQYHANKSHLSPSALSDFQRSVPYYHARYITGEIEAREPSDSMVLGSAVHALVLQPELAETLVVEMPDYGRSKADLEAKVQFLAEHRDHYALKADGIQQARAMAASVQRHPLASRLLAPCEGALNEQGITWIDKATGLPCKALFDAYRPNHAFLNYPSIIDLKTAADISAETWAKTVLNFKYDQQAAHYVEGAREVFELDGYPDFWHIAVCSSAPYEVAVYKLSAKFIIEGLNAIGDAREELMARIQNDDWSSRYRAEAIVIDPPKWAYNQPSYSRIAVSDTGTTFKL